MAGRNRVYHWKHGWIPLTHTAALSKAKGSADGAKKIEAKHGIGVADTAKASQQSARATELRAAADRERAKAQGIFNRAGVDDPAANRLNAGNLARVHKNTDSSLRRSVEATQKAQGLEHKAGLADARAKEAGRTRLTQADVKGATHVQDAYGWHEVVRVNAKTVTVKTPYSWTETIPIEKVRKTLKATPEQIAAAKKKRAS